VGFDWDNKDQVWAKVQEEIGELNEAVDEKNPEEIENEFGDVLFSLINYARFIDINPENALERTNKKFISRFQWMENQINSDQKVMSNMNLEELDAYWNKAKLALKKKD
jgi:XTP/dITP diphosphohydrolase